VQNNFTMTKLPPYPQLTADDWMPEHCLPPKTNHDDFSFTPLSLSYTSSSNDTTDEVALPLPPSRLLRHHHPTAPWSIPSDYDATLKHDSNIGDGSNKILNHPDGDGRASSPNSVTAFSPSLAVVPSRRRPRTADDNNDSSATIVEKMETYLPLCGGTSASVDTNNHQRSEGDGADGTMDDSNNRNSAELSMTVLRGEGFGQQQHERRQQQQQIKGGHKPSPPPTMQEDGSLSQLSSGMEFLAMLTCGLLNQNVTPTKKGV